MPQSHNRGLQEVEGNDKGKTIELDKGPISDNLERQILAPGIIIPAQAKSHFFYPLKKCNLKLQRPILRAFISTQAKGHFYYLLKFFWRCKVLRDDPAKVMRLSWPFFLTAFHVNGLILLAPKKQCQ